MNIALAENTRGAKRQSDDSPVALPPGAAPSSGAINEFTEGVAPLGADFQGRHAAVLDWLHRCANKPAAPIGRGALMLFPEEAVAHWRGVDACLTPLEFRLVARISADPAEIVTARMLVDAMYRPGYSVGDGTDRGAAVNVRSIIKRARLKFLSLDPAFAAIETVRSAGYRWQITPGEAP